MVHNTINYTSQKMFIVLVALLFGMSQVQAKNIFDEDYNFGTVDDLEESIFNLNDPFSMIQEDSPKTTYFRTEFYAVAVDSVKNEVDKFEEALVAIMLKRVVDYNQLRLKKENITEAQAKYVTKKYEYKQILAEQKASFSVFYTKEVNERMTKFCQGIIDSPAFSEVQAMNKQKQKQFIYQSVEMLHDEIFKVNIKHFQSEMAYTQMMVQHLLDTIHFPDDE